MSPYMPTAIDAAVATATDAIYTDNTPTTETVPIIAALDDVSDADAEVGKAVC